jgi:hypothetical protein
MTYLGIFLSLLALGVGVWGVWTRTWEAVPFAAFGIVILVIIFYRRRTSL